MSKCGFITQTGDVTLAYRHLRALVSHPSGSLKQRFGWLLIGFLTLFLTGCIKQSSLDKVQQEGVLHIVTRNAPAIYFEDKDGPAGLEYELAKLFADELGVELRVRVAPDQQEIERILNAGFTNFAAAGIASLQQTSPKYRLSPAHSEAPLLVIYKVGDYRPRELQDLAGRRVVIPASRAYGDALRRLQQEMPELTWDESNETDISEILRQVAEDEIDYTLIDASTLALYQAFYPRAQAAFEVPLTVEFSWQFSNKEDGSLVERSRRFFARIQQDGTLDHLRERYFGHVGQLNYVDARTFKHHIDTRLPKFQRFFEEAANNENVDWRLIAAMGYQESHWRPLAKSPTGVRGLMMLTQATAQYVNVSDRLDPRQSIFGGTTYFRKILDRIPERVVEPDRTWFALAAYNVGYGHLEDARILTQKAGYNPDKWADVMNHLPLLQKKKWYSQTRHGYARGEEPVRYVQNIRRYYDVLSFTTDQIAAKKNAQDEIDHQAQINLEAALDKQTAELALPDPLRSIPPAL